MGNSDAILSTRTKFPPLFFGLNQTYYQEIEVGDLLTRVNMPDDLASYQKKNETFLVAGVRGKGEGGDFILEARNRRLPPILPDKEKWKEVCNNADVLDDFHILKINEYAHYNSGQSYSRFPLFQNNIYAPDINPLVTAFMGIL
ncbi:hypothetical protein FSP39_017771 [Pinctada imbricata]|uniref:Uncharacterized protein n=1 Tax=Pinctada imbricata TaxID=66713 RepID=A0AA89BRB2_PINIB|nr:hypothetical protein FSP39_017771 [Pinctada imbricata]